MITVNGLLHASRAERSARTMFGVLLSVAMIAGVLAAVPATKAQAAPVGQGFNLDASDLRFILQQIKISENHAAGGLLLGPGPNQVTDPRLPHGLRTVDGDFNNLIAGQETFGAADRIMPRMTGASFRPAENLTFDPDGPGPITVGTPTSYTQTTGVVEDSRPRVISNLIVDQTATNPSAVAAAGPGAVPDDNTGTLFIPNVAPDVGLSAPFNSLFTFFGQFFDHGLTLLTKGGSGAVFVPLKPGDPLFGLTPNNFMVLTRATNQPGPDNVLGTADDIKEGTNTTTPFVDQNQTYTSHASHQVFLRQYALNGVGRPVPTGKLLDGAIARNIANWAEVKAQTATLLGIQLVDADILSVPLLATDPYGHFIPGPARGRPQIVMPGNVLVEGNPAAPVSVAGSVKTGHAFLDDIAHNAVPKAGLTPDPDLIANPTGPLPGGAGVYDDELLNAHFITGDGRGNENIGLTAVHSIFHSEHNRLADDIDGLVNTLLTPAEIADWKFVNTASGWEYGERLFQAARFVTEMEYQHLVFEEFARKVQPMVNLFAGYHTEIDPAITTEFSHASYRFGHSMLTERVPRTNADGTSADTPTLRLFDAFLNPLKFNDGGTGVTLSAEQAVGSIVRGTTREVANEIDEFITDALRNGLVGLPLDLATINLTRARSEGIAPLNAARRQLFDATGNPALAPYPSWFEFGLGLRHPGSLVNFVAAYGTHPTITGDVAARRAAADNLVAINPSNLPQFADATEFMFSLGAWANDLVSGATVTGLDDVDLWVGGLAEKQAPFGGLLGSTHNFVFEKQLENLQDGDRLYYLSRTAGLNLLTQLEGNSLAELITRNSDADNLPADVFSRPDFIFNLSFLGNSGPIPDDPTTPDVNESALPDLLRMPDGTVRYTGPAHVVFAGRNNPLVVDRMWASEGDDTLRGNGGRDIMEGGAGNDNFIGGEGDDILTDSFGDDVIKGGDGNDAISSGPGFDLNQGGRGNDFVIGGSDPTETFGGPGNDFIFAGDSTDTVFGDDGDDWIEGGGQADLLQGDFGNPFQDDPNGGHDVIIGDGGDDDYDSEGGDDIMVAGPGIERNEGMLGFDWVTHRGDPQPADADFFFTGLLPPDIDAIRDRFDMVEGLSGWKFNDILRGDSRDATLMIGHELNTAGIARIAGLGALLDNATFTGGNIILGGAGSDIIEGRGGNDVIDGDRWLNVQLRAPDPSTPNPNDTKLVDSMLQLRTDVFAGRINPGEITIVRSIVTTGVGTADVDTAVYSGAPAEYTITLGPNGSVLVIHSAPSGNINDGVDTLYNIEQLTFQNNTVDDLTDDVTIAVPVSPPLAVNLFASPGGPSFAGEIVVFAASTTGGTGSLEFRFETRAAGSPTWTLAQGFGSLATFTWNTATVTAGSYEFQVLARTTAAPGVVATSPTVGFVLNTLNGAVTLSANPASPQIVGASVVFTGAATAGTGPFEYRFEGRVVGSPNWALAQDFSSLATWTWNTAGGPAGSYEVRVLSRTAGGVAAVSTATIPYTLTSPALSGATLSADPSGNALVGTNVTF
ncbi:MAG: heme peroxidase, partial [Actinobacteria bacterium]|nr:heme peroxidase [Actinomycetota bacterium]